MFVTLVAALVVALVLSLAVEAAEGGAARPVSRRVGDMALRLGSYAVLTAFWFQFSWRPWLAGFSCILTVAILSVVSRLKRGVIGEPLVFSDFALLRQVPRHPELYYTRPMTDPRMAGPILASLAAVALWYGIESTALPEEPSVAVLAVLGLPLVLGALASAFETGRLSRWLASRFPRPALEADVARYGQPATLMAYASRWRVERRSAPAPEPAPPPPARRPADDVVVVVQLESFVDPVRLGGPDLPLTDVIRTRAVQYGRLTVPAHGAYTMRTEHAVLTGRNAAGLGFGVFDPYLAGGGDEPTSLARIARAAGFETLFVHPFHRDFFDRAAVVTRLGFERLVMEEAFAGARRVGPYVGDVPLAERILAEVEGRRGRLFVFSVTMENHGPWKPGRLPGIHDPFAQYLHHVAHTGEAVEALIAGLEGLRATLCVFGDHPPSLPNCRPGFGGTATDYAVLRFGREAGAAPLRIDLTADGLGCLLRSVLAPGSSAGEGLSAERATVVTQC